MSKDKYEIISEYEFDTFSVKYIQIITDKTLVYFHTKIWVISVPEFDIVDRDIFDATVGKQIGDWFIEPELSKDEIYIYGLKLINKYINEDNTYLSINPSESITMIGDHKRWTI